MKACIGCGRDMTTKKIEGWVPGKGFLCNECIQKTDAKEAIHAHW